MSKLNIDVYHWETQRENKFANLAIEGGALHGVYIVKIVEFAETVDVDPITLKHFHDSCCNLSCLDVRCGRNAPLPQCTAEAQPHVQNARNHERYFGCGEWGTMPHTSLVSAWERFQHLI